jgi:hypothetical protein
MLHFGTLQMDLHLDSHAHAHIATSARELTAVHDRYACRDAWAKASCVVNQVLIVPMLLCMSGRVDRVPPCVRARKFSGKTANKINDRERVIASGIQLPSCWHGKSKPVCRSRRPCSNKSDSDCRVRG